MTEAAYVQRHIHLGLDPLDGSAPSDWSVLHEPPLKITSLYKYAPSFEGQASFKRAFNGTPFDMSLRTSTRVPVIYTNRQIKCRGTIQEFENIGANYLHRRVWYVDVLHPNDGLDHVNYPKLMYLTDVNFEDNKTPMLDWVTFNMTFLDMNTVAPT